jgi:hypothetical protein
VSFLDALLGRDKPIRSQLDRLFGLSTAELTLATEFDVTSTKAAAISFRPVSTGAFSQLLREVEALLQASTKDSPLTWKNQKDSYGYQWIILQAEEFTNLVATVHMISRELQDNGFGEQLLASVFQFRDSNSRNVYWIYNYKRGTFYPFVPAGSSTRDNATELRLSSVMNGELAVESEPEKWYPLWGVPLT